MIVLQRHHILQRLALSNRNIDSKGNAQHMRNTTSSILLLCFDSIATGWRLSIMRFSILSRSLGKTFVHQTLWFGGGMGKLLAYCFFVVP